MSERPTEPRLGPRPAAAVALVGGAVLALAFPPYGLWPLAPLGVAALLVAAAGHPARKAAVHGLLFSLAFFGPLVWWLVNSIGFLPWLALTAAESAIVAATAAALPRLLRLRAWPLAVALWWTAGEALRGRFPLGGFPWGRLAFSQADSPLLAWARWAGAPAVTFATALVGAGLAAVVLGERGTARLRASGWLVATAAASVVLPLPNPDDGQDRATIAVVQGNVPRERTLAEQARVGTVAANHAEATKRLADRIRAGELPSPDVVIWPENALDADPSHDAGLGRLVRESVAAVDRPVLVGAILDRPGGGMLNAGRLWHPDTGPGPFQAKRNLVPFGEYIPARTLLGGLGDLQLIPRDFTPGTGTTVLSAGRVRMADVICFEVGYDATVRDGVRAGANLLVEQTNNATYMRDGSTAETEQQLAMARLRAVEHDRALVVAATSGVSAVIRPDGTTARRTGQWTQETLTADLPLRTTRTPADRVGSWPEGAAVLATIALLVPRRRTRRPGASAGAATVLAARERPAGVQ
ncbi:apolipoprotein N-acyltransferase [Streptomyces sp. FH025]|uniref:apolipoprotein N-acyltransferase n=1 Tax=Streptomyces sp. FH025 TaxID=2815937 RepID=UPI001A9F99E8|nr:apolipoprotein N-acyltransferase [Streptomyces sp. FH025]MBO1418011.1 apolipoprotein N-acyltransferase [Streptomyces sp. FH025]